MHIFILATTPMGIWIGRTLEAGLNTWKKTGQAMTMFDVRSMVPQPDPRTNRVNIMIGSPYFTDSSQLEIAVRPISVETLGEITRDKSGTEVCTDRQTLFAQYTEAITKWRASLANLTLASAADLTAINQAKQQGRRK